MSEQSVVLRPGRAKTIAIVVFAGVLAAGTGNIAIHEGGLAWIPVVLFGAVTLVLCVGLLKGGDYLELNPEGFTLASTFSVRTYRWVEIEVFRVTGRLRHKAVGFRLKLPAGDAVRGLRLRRLLTGYHGFIPNEFGMSPYDMSKLLNHWKQRLHGT